MSACGILYASGACERRCDRAKGHSGPCSGDLRAEPHALLLRDALEALRLAVKRVEIANLEGTKIMSAWLPDARTILARAEEMGL